MSCSGCKFLIGKDGLCNQSYACNTSGDRPIAEEINKKREKNKERAKK